MNYRHMGKHGLRLSELSLGAWVTFGAQVGDDVAFNCMVAAWEAGVNFFDNAESYAHGNAETVMGNVLKKTGWKREHYVLSTKIFWGGKVINNTGLNYKHVMEGMNNSLRRLQIEYVDIVFCHRHDPETPIEETVWAMDQVIRQGKAFYWGTSEWSAADIMRADAIARANGLRPPAVEQPQYNLLWRERMELEYLPVFRELGYGTTVWSPLASGILTGKYNKDIPEGSRMAVEEWLLPRITPQKIEKVKQLQPIADELGCTLAQLAIAWCLLNPNVSTVITGASSPAQINENMKAVDVVAQLTPDVVARIEEILANKPQRIIY